MEETLRALLKGEFSSLHLGFNDHASNYLDASTADQEGEFERADWVSDAEREKALRDNTVWILQWYPDTPIGFCCIAASSLEAIITAAEGFAGEDDRDAR